MRRSTQYSNSTGRYVYVLSRLHDVADVTSEILGAFSNIENAQKWLARHTGLEPAWWYFKPEVGVQPHWEQCGPPYDPGMWRIDRMYINQPSK